MVAELQRKNQELKMAYRDTLNAVVNTLEAATLHRGHTERVTTIAKAIAVAWACPARTVHHRMGPCFMTWARSA